MTSISVPPAVAAIPPHASGVPLSALGSSSIPTVCADAASARGNPPARFDGCRVGAIAPCDGWSLMWTEEEDGDGFVTDLYYARSDTGDRLINHCRFDFTPTQARFNWLARNGFPSRLGGSWTDAMIDAAMAAQAVAA